MSSGESAWAAGRKTETAEPAESADAATAAAPAAPAANKTSPAKDDRTPSFTPTAATPASSAAPAAPAAAAPAAAPTTATPAAPAPQAPSYAAAGASHASSPGYSRSAWSAAADATAASGSAPAPAPARPAPAGGNGRVSSNGFSTGAAATAVTGAAAGLANSVSSAWQKQKRGGSARTIQTRKSTKRQAMLTLARVEPWSVMKFSFVASVVAFIILFVAVAVLYMVLSALGVFDSLQHTVSSITSSQSDAGTNISHWFSASLILGYTAMLGALNIVLITAMSTVGSVIYNLIAKTIGGIEVTLRETD
jgi:Transmembrane domain of unknown function (DUF3566)